MKLKKIVVVMSMVLALGTGNVFGAVKAMPKAEELEQLTVEDATKIAIAESDRIAELKDAIANLEEEGQRTKNSLINTTTSFVQVLNTQDALTQNENDISAKRQELKVEPEVIGLSVVRSFVEILNSEAALVQYDKAFELQEKSFAITELRKDLGMISDSDFNTEKISFEKTRDSRKTYVDNIDNAYRNLNRLLDKDPEKRYELVFDVDYEVLGDVNLNSIISKCVSIDKDIKAYLASIGLTEKQIETYVLRIVNESTGEIKTDVASKESYERRISQYSRGIETHVKTIEDNIKASHTSIVNMEDDYEKKTGELANMYKQLEIKKVQLELGQITALELQNFQVNSIDKTESEIQSLIYNHYVQVMKFKNANLAAKQY